MSLTANEIAVITANGNTPAAGDSIPALLAKLVNLLGANHYLGTHTYTFPGNDEGALADLMATELALYPTVRQVAIFNSGVGTQVIDGDNLTVGSVAALTLAEVIAATYAITGTGDAELTVFFIA